MRYCEITRVNSNEMWPTYWWKRCLSKTKFLLAFSARSPTDFIEVDTLSCSAIPHIQHMFEFRAKWAMLGTCTALSSSELSLVWSRESIGYRGFPWRVSQSRLSVAWEWKADSFGWTFYVLAVMYTMLYKRTSNQHVYSMGAVICRLVEFWSISHKRLDDRRIKWHNDATMEFGSVTISRYWKVDKSLSELLFITTLGWDINLKRKAN